MKQKLAALIKEGFKFTSEYSRNCKLYRRGYEQIIFNLTDDREVYRYDIRNPFAKKEEAKR